MTRERSCGASTESCFVLASPTKPRQPAAEAHRQKAGMDPANLTIGASYYRLAFADIARTIPGVTPMIYVGVNIFAGDDPNTPVYYFQDTVYFSELGSVASSRFATE